MSKTRIFVSSTCYDLAPVREDLRNHIIQLGHDPILSEYPSFPINPDDTAITNCTKNVWNSVFRLCQSSAAYAVTCLEEKSQQRLYSRC